MELNIIKEKDMPLLDRKRVTATITSQEGKTPSRLSVKKIAAKQLKSKEENIVIRHIYSKFGSSISMNPTPSSAKFPITVICAPGFS